MISDKWRQSFLELASSGRYHNHYLWLLTEFYLFIPKNIIMQAKSIFGWYPNVRENLKMIHDEIWRKLSYKSSRKISVR